MTLPLAPTVPNPNSASFSDDAYVFTQWMATVGPAIDIETARIDTIGFGSYSATSTTSLSIGTGSKSLVIAAGKSFAIGQPVMCASSVTPSNFMFGQVTSYNPATGALVINVLSISGSGTLAAWSVSVGASVVGGGVSPDSIVTLTSGTSWTCPAGVTKVRLSMVGGGGGGSAGDENNTSGSGGNAGGVIAVLTLVPGTAYTYAIGASGVRGASPTAGGTTTFTAGGVTYSASGGMPGTSDAFAGGGEGGSGSGTGAFTVVGQRGTSMRTSGGYPVPGEPPGNTILGRYGCGGEGTTLSLGGVAGVVGAVLLELYK